MHEWIFCTPVRGLDSKSILATILRLDKNQKRHVQNVVKLSILNWHDAEAKRTFWCSSGMWGFAIKDFEARANSVLQPTFLKSQGQKIFWLSHKICHFWLSWSWKSCTKDNSRPQVLPLCICAESLRTKSHPNQGIDSRVI